MFKVQSRPSATMLATAACVVLAGMASAQSSTRITLQSINGSDTITGEFIAMTDDGYRIDTLAGEMTITVQGVTCTGAACPAIFVMGAQITLTSLDGSVNIDGEIRGLENGQYVILSKTMGMVQINTDLVDCTGPGCPTNM
ncbi:hypothetical protein [Yoonia sp.]|uniref:hypothetical protein n=1 Tax=Yoonia sp. TaxID=2212373 RepID=UPI002601326F|nr:hypothetical protein [Yoonia sp.]